MVLTNGFHRGVFVSRSHDAFYCNNFAFVHGSRHHHYPYFGFSLGFGFGFPFYASYYSAYPYWWSWDPWYYSYPYYGGVYVGYPAYPYYRYPYDQGDTYIYNNYYTSPSTSGTAPAAPEQPMSLSGASAAEEGAIGQITPLPKAETVERAEAGPEESGVLAGAPSETEALSDALMGLAAFRDGRYPEAAENLYLAAQAEPSSPALKVYLAESLFAIGEYKFAAEYLRQALATRPGLALEPFDLGRLYAQTTDGQADLENHLRLLRDRVSLEPYDADTLLVLGFIQIQNGNLTGAAGTLLAMSDYSENPANQEAASQLFAALQLRNLALSGDLPQGIPAMNALGEPAGAPQGDELGEALSGALY